MDQLELAMRYLRDRSVSTEKKNHKIMWQLRRVVQLSELEAVLEMVKSGEFEAFYNKFQADYKKMADNSLTQ